MFLGSHRARTTSRVETSGVAALDAARPRCKGLGITNAEESALVPERYTRPTSIVFIKPWIAVPSMLEAALWGLSLATLLELIRH